MRLGSITEVGGLIQQRRTDLGLTQAQVADRSKVSRDWIVSIENGRRLSVDFERLLRTLEVLDLTIEIRAVAGEEQSDADRAVLETLARSEFNDLTRLRDEFALTELREQVAELIDPAASVSDETRRALLAAVRESRGQGGSGRPDGDS